MRHCVSLARYLFLTLILIVVAKPGFAQVKLEDTLKKPAKPVAPSASNAAPIKQLCEKPPCTTTFTPVAAYIAPDWYAQQEKDQKEAGKSRQKAIAYLEKYKAHAIKRGWELNDIARSYAFFVSLTYNVFSQGKGPDQREMEKLTARFRQELAKDAKFQANNDRDRQFIYERLILVALDNEAGYVFAKQRNDVRSQQKHRERAKLWLEDVIEKPIDQIPNYWK